MAFATVATMSNLQSAVENAIEYAGFSGLTVTWGAHFGTNVDGVQIRIGEGTTDNLFVTATIGGSNNYFGAGINSGSTVFGTWTGRASNNFRVIATKKAVAITNLNSSDVSAKGVIITKDNNGDWCGVVTNSTDNNLNSPIVVPRNAAYTTAVNYTGAPTTAFGATALAKIPVPSFDGSAKFMPDVSFAHAAQYLVDGEVTLDGLRYYCIGGSWWLKDTIEEVS